MSDFIQKAKDFVTGHPDQADQGLDKAEELVNERTGGTHSEQIDQGADKVRESLGLPADTDAGTAPAPVDPAVPGTGEGDIALGEPPQHA
jgi:hypothetical protein